jgi:predicted acylesterase/phospholipase RssA
MDLIYFIIYIHMVTLAIIHKGKKSRPQRALVLQGGGALGAYEAGAFKALYESII